MHIKKIKMKNFKRFEDETTINFNNNINILVGDNDTGKSTILQAIELVLSGSKQKIKNIGLENIFNINSVNSFLSNDIDNYTDLPVCEIELYLSDESDYKLNGKINSEKLECNGIKLKIEPDDEYEKDIKKILQNKEQKILPFEFYSINFNLFSGDPYNSYNKPVDYIFVNGNDLSNNTYLKKFIQILYNNSNVDKNQLELDYRKSKKEVNVKLANIQNKFNYKFQIYSDYNSRLENNLTILKNDMNIYNLGTGSQEMIKIMSTIDEKIDGIQFILIEEPENHLSDHNLRKLLADIKKNKKQMFITTHNSMICSKLDLKNIIGLSNKMDPMYFKDLDSDTANYFEKCTSNSILNFILSDKVILVEGPSEYVLIDELYKIYKNNIYGCSDNVTLNDNNITVISVNGLSFKRFLNVAKLLKKRVAVLTDNDKNIEKNINKKYDEYEDNENIKIFSSLDEKNYTFEVCLYNANKEFYDNLFDKNNRNVLDYLIDNKTETALKITKKLNEGSQFNIPKYIKDAFNWINEI